MNYIILQGDALELLRTLPPESVWIDFFCTSIFFISYMLFSFEKKFTSIRAYRISVLISYIVYSTIRIRVMFFICRFFFVHGKYH